MIERYFVTGPVDEGYAYWDVRDREAGDLGPNFSLMTIYRHAPLAEFQARTYAGLLNLIRKI